MNDASIQDSPVSQAAAPRAATAAELGASFARLALREASDIASFAESVKGCKAHEDHKVFVGFRDTFKAAATGAGYADADKLWSRTWAAAKGFGLLADFPKSQGEAATKKADQRAEKAAKLEEAVRGKTPAELLAEGRAALDAGDAGKASDMIAAAKKAASDADKAAKKAASDAVKVQRERIKAAMERCGDDAKMLKKLADACDKAAPKPADAPV